MMRKKILAMVLSFVLALSVGFPSNATVSGGDAVTVVEDEKLETFEQEIVEQETDTLIEEELERYDESIATNMSYTGQLLAWNEVRQYDFSLEDAGKVTVTFNHEHISDTRRYWVIRVYNDRQEYVLGMNSAGTDINKTSAEVGLPAGNYYIKVNSDDYEASYEYEYSSKPYTLKVNYTKSSVWETESNDSLKEADLIEVNKSYSGANQFSDDVDYYKFQLSSAGRVSINFAHENIVASGRYWVARVYNDKTEHMLTLDVGAGDTNKTSAEVGLPAGNYYIKVNSDDYEASYEYEYSSLTYALKIKLYQIFSMGDRKQ